MATLLLSASNRRRQDSTDDDYDGAYKLGDVIQVIETDLTLKSRMGVSAMGAFAIIHITDVTMNQALKYCGPDFDGVRPENNIPVYTRRRLYRLLWNSLPAGVRSQLINNREYTTTWSAIRTYIQNRRTGATE